MSQEYAIEVEDVKKRFRVYKDKGYTLKEKVLFRKRNSYQMKNVLNGISFKIKKGQAVGLIGHNGCGKSTTLKLLTEIMYPDSGKVKVNGRVSSLLELGAGFHPDMSGRDNIYINASIFGLTRKEIDARIQNIIDFSEMAAFIDNPVRTYSSGMYMRLAFSVAINVDADVLLIDEILAVGDAAFQSKCIQRLREIKNNGTTIVIVSHSMGQIESICDRSIWINEGKIVMDGKPSQVHRAYMEFLGDYSFVDETMDEKSAIIADSRHKGSGEIKFDKAMSVNEKGEYQNVYEQGEEIGFYFHYKVEKEMEVNLHFCIYREDDMLILGTSIWEDLKKTIILKKDGSFTIKIPKLPLLPSRYSVEIQMLNVESKSIDTIENACKFQVISSGHEGGVCLIDHKWEFKEDR